MSVKNPLPVPLKGDLRGWADKLVSYLRTLERDIDPANPTVIQLEHKQAGAKATTDGLLMFHPTLGIPVYSYNNAWHSVVDGSVVA